MADEKVLVINKGEEFKAIIIDKIDKTNIFYDQYMDAAGMLDDIVAKRGHEPEMWCRCFATDSARQKLSVNPCSC